MIELSYTAEEREQVFRQLTEAKTIFAGRGWFPATSGNLSMRLGAFDPDRFQFAITASGKDKSVNTPEDFLLVDQEGKPMEKTNLKPSAETAIHREIYRLTGCGAIYHIHTVFNNVISEYFGDQGEVYMQGVELIKGFNIWEENAEIAVPVLPNYAAVPQIAALIADRIHLQIPGILLRNHGIYAWGDGPFEAKRHLEAFEFLFEHQYRSLLLRRDDVSNTGRSSTGPTNM